MTSQVPSGVTNYHNAIEHESDVGPAVTAVWAANGTTAFETVTGGIAVVDPVPITVTTTTVANDSITFAGSQWTCNVAGTYEFHIQFITPSETGVGDDDMGWAEAAEGAFPLAGISMKVLNPGQDNFTRTMVLAATDVVSIRNSSNTAAANGFNWTGNWHAYVKKVA